MRANAVSLVPKGDSSRPNVSTPSDQYIELCLPRGRKTSSSQEDSLLNKEHEQSVYTLGRTKQQLRTGKKGSLFL